MISGTKLAQREAAAKSPTGAADWARRVLQVFDVDGNGVISQSEASVDAELMSKFSELDTDGNGELSKQEFSKA